MEPKKIERINALARKSKSPEGLTEAEQAEQAVLRRAYIDSVLGNLKGQLDHTPQELAERDALRREYIDAVKANLTAQLDNTYIQTPDGKKRKLERK